MTSITTFNTLISIGFTSKHTGTRFLGEAIDMVLAMDTYKVALRAQVYPVLAEKYNCSWQNIERNIRTAIAYVYRTRPEKLDNLMGHKLEKPPTPTEVIWTICEMMNVFKQ